jgi:hypothetical protein
LENEEDMEQVEHFDWNMQAKYQGMDFEDGEEQ